MVSKYPKIINHHGFTIEKLAVGVYKYLGYVLVSDDIYGGFCFLDKKPRDCFDTYSSLVMACRAIDNSFARPAISTLPIDIVSINYKSL